MRFVGFGQSLQKAKFDFWPFEMNQTTKNHW